MNRRTFLATMGALAALEAVPGRAAGGNAKGRSTSNSPPRKVIVGTVMQSFWGQYPGLDNRLDQLAAIVDQMAAQAKQRYGRGIDLAAMPETAITGEAEGDALARKGAELIVWPTQSPQTSQPAFRAKANRFYIVSSTWRHNASIFEPTGKITAQIMPPQNILVHELDLSYALLPWSSKLRNGEALRKAYGDKVGFHYYEDEDCGIFWSNDPGTTIGEMVRSIGVLELEDEMARVREFYRKAKVRK